MPNLSILVLLLALLGATPASAADPLTEALALPVASDLVGARDVPRFAWVERAAGVRNIHVADRGRPSRRVTDFREDDGQPIYGLALSPEGGTLAFVRGGDGEFPDDALPNTAAAPSAPRQTVHVLALSGGGAAQAIGEGHSPVFSPDGRRVAFTRQGEIWLWAQSGEAERLATVRGEVSRLGWSPDGTRLAFVDIRGDHSFVALLDVGARTIRYVDPGLGYSIEPAFSPDGKRIAFVRQVDPPMGAGLESGPYWSIRAAEVATGEGRQLWAPAAGIGGRWMGTRGRNLYWSTDGHIVFPWERSGWLHPYAIAIAGGGPRELTPGAFEVDAYTLAPDGRTLVYSSNEGDLDHRRLWRVALAGGRPERLTGGREMVFFPVHAGDALAAIATGVDRPAYPVLVGRELRPLGRPVTASGFRQPETVTFRAEDGVEVRAQLFRGQGKGPLPAVVFIHGGPRRQMLPGFHTSGYYSHAYILNQHLAARGYHVLSVNYRSGTGYGRAFRDAPDVARAGAAEYRDILAAGRWLAARGEVDAKRIGVWGGSWGGYLTALALARNSDLFAAGVDLHGVHSMLRPLPNNLSPDAQTAARQMQWESSPLGAIERWRSPVLLIHGDDDRNVDFSQSVVLVRELAARGIPYREMALPNERHSFFRYENWLAAFRATVAFLDETLKGGGPTSPRSR